MQYEDGDWIDFPLFKEEVELTLHDEGISQEYIAACVRTLQSLSGEILDCLCAGSAAYCQSMQPYFAELEISIPEQLGPRKILQYIRPCSMIIDEPEDAGIGFSLELNCDWEPEHGMQWVVLDGRALYVGAFTGESPWNGDTYFKKASWNYLALE